MKFQELDRWHTPATDFPRRQEGNFRINSRAYKRGVYHNWGVRGIDYVEVLRPVIITTLEERRGRTWHTWMVDDSPQWWAMEEYAMQSEGKVLTAGLGLGLYVHALVPHIRAGRVENITVVEREESVIDLMLPNLPSISTRWEDWEHHGISHHVSLRPWLPVRLSIVHGDFYRFVDETTERFDTIMVDLWVTHGSGEKMHYFAHEVLPLLARLRMRWPDAKLCFHGFTTIGDMRLWPEGFNPHILK